MIKELLFQLCLFTLGACKGVYFWCYYNHRELDSYSSGTWSYDDLDIAKNECLKRTDCFGITRESGMYTLRQDWQLRPTTKSVVSWVPCGGYFRCLTFGLKSVHGKFLSVPSDGSFNWNSNQYGLLEQVDFHQWGENSGFLRSTHWKYLSATSTNRLNWGSSSRGSREMFTVHQDEDKVAFQSTFGGYLSAEQDGSVSMVPTLGSSEWFSVHTRDCLNNMYCNCSKEIVGDNYEMLNMDFHSSGGSVKSFSPERVGYQLIDNSQSSGDQSTTFTVSETVSEKSTFERTVGASVTVGTSFKCGVPMVGEGTISLDLSAKYEFTTGEEKVESKTMQAQYNCVAPAGKIVSCEALLFKYRLIVPYTQTWHHKRLPCSCQSEGIYTEIAAHEMRLMVKED